MQTGIVTKVLAGDMLVLDNGNAIIRICNVWAPDISDPLGAELQKVTEDLALGKEVQYDPTSHIHFDNVSLVSEVYVGSTWVNQVLRYWLADRLPRFAPVLTEEGRTSG